MRHSNDLRGGGADVTRSKCARLAERLQAAGGEREGGELEMAVIQAEAFVFVDTVTNPITVAAPRAVVCGSVEG
jgi:hypothetical protein